jgi:hypothetical protein
VRFEDGALHSAGGQLAQRLPRLIHSAHAAHVALLGGVHVAALDPGSCIALGVHPGQRLRLRCAAVYQMRLGTRQVGFGQLRHQLHPVARLDGLRLVHQRVPRTDQRAQRLQGSGALAHGEDQTRALEGRKRRVGFDDLHRGAVLRQRAPRGLENSAIRRLEVAR